MTTAASRPSSVLLFEARRLLGISREELGGIIGWSKRTIARWESGQTDVYKPSLHELARHVYPHDTTLAAEIALVSGTTLQMLGVIEPPAPPPAPLPEPAPAPPPPLPAHLLADSVVCAAADALKAIPETVRPAILAAFRRARELRMTVDEVEQALAPSE